MQYTIVGYCVLVEWAQSESIIALDIDYYYHNLIQQQYFISTHYAYHGLFKNKFVYIIMLPFADHGN